MHEAAKLKNQHSEIPATKSFFQSTFILNTETGVMTVFLGGVKQRVPIQTDANASYACALRKQRLSEAPPAVKRYNSF